MQFRDKLGDKVIIISRGKSEEIFRTQVSYRAPQPNSNLDKSRQDFSCPTSEEPNSIVSNKIFNTGLIPAGKSGTVTIPSTRGNIPYFCLLHPSEKSTIVVIPKDENSLGTAEWLEFSDTAVLAFRDTSERDAVRAAAKRHCHPKTLLKIADPDLVKIHNKIFTIVFWDLSGFSALCEKIKGHPVLVVEFLKEYYAKATEIIHKYDGVLDKFIGDGGMAFFGFHARRDNHGTTTKHAIHAVNAAIELKESFEKIKTVWLDIWRNKINDGNISIGLKCGINTGYPSWIIPTKERDEFTAVGSHVNLASRLE